MIRAAVGAALLVLSGAVAPLAAQRRPTPPPDKDPNDWVSYYQYGLELLPRRPDRAETYFAWASRLDPSVAEPWVGRYAAWWRDKPQLWEMRAEGDRLALEDKDAQKTTEWMRHAYLINPFVHVSLLIYTYPPGWEIRRDRPYFRGIHDFYEGRWLEATEEFRAALQNDPEMWDGLFFSGLAYVQMRRWADAQREFRALIDSISALERRRTVRTEVRTFGAGFGAIKKPDAYYALGLMYMLAGDKAQASTAFQHAFEVDLSYHMAHLHFGNLLLEARDTTGALKEYALAVEVKPEDEVLRFNYGTVLLTAGRVDSAVVQITEAIRINSDYALPYFNQGLCFERLGRRDDARQAYEAFLRLAPRRMGNERALAQARLAGL